MSLSAKVLAGLAAGLAAGVFFGEWMAPLDIVGRAFVLLLQMTVLPYLVVSLVAALGGLHPPEARSLARNAGVFLLSLWGIGMLAVVASPLAFPSWKAASFFSSSLVETAEAPDLLRVYIPANPFASLAEGVVPATVIFSTLLGVALMGTERKEELLAALRGAEDALARATNLVVEFAPFGVFAIAANAAGTLSVDDFHGLQVFGLTYVVASLAVGLVVLPLLVSAVTPIGYREVLGPTRDALVTAFATGSLFVVLPILNTRIKELISAHTPDEQRLEDASRIVDVVVPIAYTLPSVGKLLSLSFVPFAGWMTGFPMAASQLPEFLVSGLFASFASLYVAIPSLLEQFRVPADTFQLFVVVNNVVGSRFGSLVGGVHLISLSLLGAAAGAGLLRLQRVAFARWLAVSTVCLLAGLGAVRVLFNSVDKPYQGYTRFIERSLLGKAAPHRERPELGAGRGGTAIERIRGEGVIRVGHVKDALPFAFRNERGELVGFDVEMAHVLARDMGIRLELVPVPTGGEADALASGAVDVMMTGMAISPRRLQRMRFTRPYLEETLAFVVEDHRRAEFSSAASVRALTDLRIGIPRRDGYYGRKLAESFPDAELVGVGSPRNFFAGQVEGLDAMAYGAAAASAWVLIYPTHTVAVPHPEVLKVPMGYAVALDSGDLLTLLDSWIELKRRDRTLERLFDYWISGKQPAGATRRWSVAQDVLGWGGGASGEEPDPGE